MRNKKRTDILFYLKKISQGVILSLIIFCWVFASNENIILGEIFLSETIPGYEPSEDIKMTFKFNNQPEKILANNLEDAEPVFVQQENVSQEVLEEETFDPIKVEENINYKEGSVIIGLNDIIYQPEVDNSNIEQHLNKEAITIENIENLKNIEYLKNKFYVVDKRTNITPELFNVDEFIKTNLKIDLKGKDPKVLIFHTHSNEKYIGSKDKTEGVIGVGEKLKQVLESEYGIISIHDTGTYDMVDGASQIKGSYERAEPIIRKILKDNPTIEIAIDLHRDGVKETIRLVDKINEKDTAQIMFFNGLSKLNEDGVLKNIDYLPNPYLKTNLALSFNMQLAANKLYPGFTRKVYLNAYRYNLHMLPKSLLIEVGAQTNTKDEAYNAVEPLAKVLATVILK